MLAGAVARLADVLVVSSSRSTLLRLIRENAHASCEAHGVGWGRPRRSDGCDGVDGHGSANMLRRTGAGEVVRVVGGRRVVAAACLVLAGYSKQTGYLGKVVVYAHLTGATRPYAGTRCRTRGSRSCPTYGSQMRLPFGSHSHNFGVLVVGGQGSEDGSLPDQRSLSATQPSTDSAEILDTRPRPSSTAPTKRW